MNLYATLRDRIIAAIADIVPALDPATLARIEVTPTRDPAHGDMATNAALIAAKPARRAPAAIAAELAAHLATAPELAGAEPAGPGFVNLRLRPQTLHAVLPAILHAGTAYGDATIGQGIRVNVEYVSANPTGPLTVGHCRGAVVGDALATLMAKAGYSVTREYYVNDAGNQVNKLAESVYRRYLEALQYTPDEINRLDYLGPAEYPGDYLVEVGRSLADTHGRRFHGADPSVWRDLFRDETMAILLGEIRHDLARLGVHHDVFTCESAILATGAPDTAIAALDARGLIYQGTLEPPKGKLPEDWEPRIQTLFAATRLGDDVDRPLRKSDGTNTYFANDIGYHATKIHRGFDIIIDVLGADHGGYVCRMRAAVAALSDSRVEFDAVLCQIVHILKSGKPVRMSKRAGTYVTLSDLLDQVGPDAVRFTMLMRKPDAQMEFDIDAAIAQTRDNPVFYVQYAHARCRSVLRAAADLMPGTDDATLAQADLTPLTDPAEAALLRRLIAWPRLIEGAAAAREPHRVAFYLYDLAGDFHMLWNKGREATTLRFIQADAPAATRARLALVAATAIVIRSGLAVLGVTPVEEMR